LVSDCHGIVLRMSNAVNNTDYCGESMSEEDTLYSCDKCDKDLDHNEESYEVSYGFVCRDCFEAGR
jgi:DNA-directed RNA polymerase subunit RPC12/RpoP